jgi:hypothetical protein
MTNNDGLKKIGDLFNEKKYRQADPAGRSQHLPSYPWQDLALRVIQELGVPDFKRSAVFKICKLKPRINIEKYLNDTKELCHSGEKWKYFFKIAGGKNGELKFKVHR